MKRYKHNSILLRNLLISAILEIILVLGITSFYTAKVEKNAMNEIVEASVSELKQTAKTLDSVYGQMSNFAYYMATEEELQFLFMEYTMKDTSEIILTLSERIKNFCDIFDYVDAAYVYVENKGVVTKSNSSALTQLRDMEETGWLSVYEELGENRNVIRTRCKDEVYPFLMTMAFPIKDEERNVQGAVIIDIDLKDLNKSIGRSSADAQKIYMIDQGERLYYSNIIKSVKYPEIIPTGLYQNYLNKDGETAVREEKEEQYLITTVSSKAGSWKYIMYSGMNIYDEALQAARRQLLRNSLVAILVGFAVSVLLSIQSYRPIQKIIKKANEEENSNEFIEGMDAQNEIEYITQLIQNSNRKNKVLQIEVSEGVEKLGQAQMLALQSQINPHFLYNTLDSINWMMVERLGTDNPVSKAISSLAKLLRISMTRTSYLIPLEEEIEHAVLYMKLMEIRYPGKLHVKWEIPDALLQKKVIRLCLQPILENAILHGLKDKRFEGNICVSAEVINDILIVRVIDDGIGMSIEECRRMNNKLSMEYQIADRHVGIENVNQRIKILFGENCGVLLRPGKAKGLEVDLCFQANMEVTAYEEV